MSNKEIKQVLKKNFERFKNEWEQTRMIASSMVGKVDLPWDKDIKKVDDTKNLEERQQLLMDAAKNIKVI